MYTEEAWFLRRRHENVNLGISSVPPSNRFDYFLEIQRVDDWVLFDSDWLGPMTPSIGENVDAVRELSVPADTVDRILRENARSLFGLLASPGLDGQGFFGNRVQSVSHDVRSATSDVG